MEETVEYVRNLCQSDKLPIMFIAKNGDEIVGAVAVAMSDLNVRPDLYPNIINLYVKPEYRSMGIGTKLLSEICKATFNFTNWCNRIYLYTDIKGLYEKLGWTNAGNIDTVHLQPRIQTLYYIDRPEK